VTRLLLLSNSTSHGLGYLDHAMAEILSFLAPVPRLLFVPYALADRSGYIARARERFGREGIEVVGLVEGEDARTTVVEAQAIFVGGGNTFRLLDRLQRGGLLEPIRRRVLSGMPYLGASAGTNVACPTIRTTNDMPIVQPSSLDALGLVPFQINPHYLDPDPDSRHMGETREERIREFHEENEAPVVGLREGCWIRVEGDAARLAGPHPARIFQRGKQPREVPAGTDIGEILAGSARLS
jgi:dipeptidase E